MVTHCVRTVVASAAGAKSGLTPLRVVAVVRRMLSSVPMLWSFSVNDLDGKLFRHLVRAILYI